MWEAGEVGMMNRKKVIKGLEWILDGDRFGFGVNWHIDSEPKSEEEQAGYYIQRAIDLLKEQDAVVRCKDCKYCEYPNAEREWCKKGHLHGNAETWFCADGKRR